MLDLISFLVEAMAKAGVAQVLTDDGDYCTVRAFTFSPPTGRRSMRRGLKGSC